MFKPKPIDFDNSPVEETSLRQKIFIFTASAGLILSVVVVFTWILN